MKNSLQQRAARIDQISVEFKHRSSRMLVIIGETVDNITPDAAPDTRPKAANEDFFTGEASQNKQLGDQLSRSAPRVTIADIEASIASEHYFTAADGADGAEINAGGNPAGAIVPIPLHLLTFCVLVLRNGHTVTGESFCADPAKFNAQTGRVEARKVAINKLWPMAVYAERERLAQGGAA